MKLQKIKSLMDKSLSDLTHEELELLGGAEADELLKDITNGDLKRLLNLSQGAKKCVKRFEKDFVKKSFQYKQFTFGKDDLEFLRLLASETINPPQKNRDKSNDNIHRLVRCMVKGEWFPEVLDIHIDPNGRMKNGQHSIDALIQYLEQHDCPDDAQITLGFKLGSNPKAMAYMDSCRPRSPMQTLAIEIDGNTTLVNKNMKDVIKFATKEKIHDFFPLRYGSTSKMVNFFEMQEVIDEYSELLVDLFGELGFPRQDWSGGIRYALFKLAQDHRELAVELSKDIRDVHAENWSESEPELSDYVDLNKEHDVLEYCRSKKYSKKFLAKRYIAPDYYDATAEWIVEHYPEVDAKTFAKTEE